MGLDVDDISDLYARHARAVVVFFVRRTYDADTAVELMAETFASAMSDRRSFRGERSEAVGWVYGIARHKFSGWVRHQHVERRGLARLGLEPPHVTDDEIERIEELAGSAELRAEVAAHLEELREEYRRAVELRVIDERSYEDVARLLGISEQAARARVSRGLRALHAALEGEYA